MSSFEDRIAEAAKKIKKKQARKSKELRNSINHTGPKTAKDEKDKLLKEMNDTYGINDSLAAEVYHKGIDKDDHLVNPRELSEALDEPTDAIMDALYKLADLGLAKPPSGLNTSHEIIEKPNSNQLLKSLSENYDTDDNNPSLRKLGSEKSNSSALLADSDKEKSLFDTLKSAQTQEANGLLSIAANTIHPKDAVKAHEMMDTDDQMKAFMVQNARYQLTRVVKLERALSKIEDKYIDNTMESLDNLSQETLEQTMATIRDSLGRAADIIDKYYGDPDLKLFVEDIAVNSKENANPEQKIAQNKESRERIRVVASKFLTMLSDDSNTKGGEDSTDDTK